MGNYLLAAGLLLNSALIVTNRYWKKLPGWLHISGLVLGIILIIAGGVMMKTA